MRRSQRGRVVLALFPFTSALLGIPARGFAVMNDTTECLVDFEEVPRDARNGGTVQCTDCDPSCDADGIATPNGSCVFNLQVCVDEAGGACTAAPLKRVKVSGNCGAAALTPSPSGTGNTCGPSTGLTVKLKRKGKKAGKCKVTARATSSDKPKKVDKDVLTLVCNPYPTGEACPTTTTTTTSTSSTTTTLVCGNGVIDAGEQCDPPGTQTGCTGGQTCDDNCQCASGVCARVEAGHPITGTYQTVTLPSSDPSRVKICTTNAPDSTKRFGPCDVDSDCGTPVVTGACAQTPWVDAGGVTQPTGKSTLVLSVTAGAFPACEHSVCIQCGNLGKCPDISGGCDDAMGNNVNCPIGDECCLSPGFTLDALLIGPGVLNFCTKVNQTACGFGVINTSNPQTGDNETKREADTSDPGADCRYGTADDNPSPGKACCGHGAGGSSNSQAGSCSPAQGFPAQGDDTTGRIKVTTGDGSMDAPGIQIRVLTPGLATTWADGAGCPADATFDSGESLISQLPQSAEPTTAGATGAFVDLNGDGCERVGAGFSGVPNVPQNGPYTVSGTGAAVLPIPYGGGSFRTVTIGEAFSAASPLFDVGFVAITPTGAPTFQGPAQACTCPAVHSCPECDAGTPGCP